MDEAENLFHLSTNPAKKVLKAALFPTPEISEPKENIKTQQPFRVSTPEMISNHPPQNSHPCPPEKPC